MSAFAVGEKVALKSDPSRVMEVVEIDGATVICSFKKDEKRKIKPFPAADLQKA